MVHTQSDNPWFWRPSISHGDSLGAHIAPDVSVCMTEISLSKEPSTREPCHSITELGSQRA